MISFYMRNYAYDKKKKEGIFHQNKTEIKY